MGDQVAAKIGSLNPASTLDDGAVIPWTRIPGSPTLGQAPRVPVNSAAAVDVAVELVTPYVDDLSPTQVDDVVAGACDAKDLVELGQVLDWEEAAEQALDDIDDGWRLRDQVAGLGERMQTLQDGADDTSVAAVLLLCDIDS